MAILFKNAPFVAVSTPSRKYSVSFLADSTGLDQHGCLTLAVETLLKEYDQLVLLTDKSVQAAYQKTLDSLSKLPGLLLLVVEEGERSKSRETKAIVEDAMLKTQVSRNSALVAFGGGVVGDLGGYVAATFMRGIDYYQYPTSLLAMVDSSVGGKTGVNVPAGKNLIGAIYQPKQVIIDARLLSTLPKEELSNGATEIIKIALSFDASFVDDLDKNAFKFFALDFETTSNFIKRAVELKAMVTSKDEKELGLRKCLNYGHSVGHALEAGFSYLARHGEAISYGICVETNIAIKLGHCNPSLLKTVTALLEHYNLPTNKKALLAKVSEKMTSKEEGGKLSSFSTPVVEKHRLSPTLSFPEADTLLETLKQDKKNIDGLIHMTAIESIGKLKSFAGNYTTKISEQTFLETLANMP